MTTECSATERRLAAAMHLCTIPAPFVAPAVALVVARKSDYLKAHAWQSLKEFIVWKLALVLLLALSLSYSVSRIWHHYQSDWSEFSIWEFLLRFAAGWLFLTVLGGINTVQAVVAAHKAHCGTWPKSRRKALKA
jgi:uncharacterized membrane protein